MSLVPALLALLLPAATGAEPLSGRTPSGIDDSLPLTGGLQRVPVAAQVRIEQRITIRIAPRRPAAPPAPAFSLPNRPRTMSVHERHMGKCLPVSSIAGVQVSTDNRLLLYLRDRRVVGASLERACRARDFYSGFYLERHIDGKLCVDRDTLLSRSGANCRISRLRQLVEDGD